VNFYQINFQLMQNHSYSLSDIENMLPWEREIYLQMLLDQMKERSEAMEKQNLRSG
tara:strand:- start:4691 stop:4858 length:168 start_codon:yes stop_codon:yes gene_type:complete